MSSGNAPEVYAEWLRRQGFRVLQSASGYWYSEGHGVFQAFPYEAAIAIGKEERRELSARGARILRYSAPEESGFGCPSYHLVCEGPGFDLERLNASSRRNVRDGLKKCGVERISFSYLVENGWALTCQTEARQGRGVGSLEAWRSSNLACADLPLFEAWGAFADSALAAFLVSFQMGECGYMLYQRSSDAHLKDHANHALAFTWMKEMLGRPGIQSLFNGMESLDGPDSLDEFKLRMGYVKRPVRQCVTLPAWFGDPLRAPASRCLSLLNRMFPSSRALSKARGLMRMSAAQTRPRTILTAH